MDNIETPEQAARGPQVRWLDIADMANAPLPTDAELRAEEKRDKARYAAMRRARRRELAARSPAERAADEAKEIALDRAAWRQIAADWAAWAPDYRVELEEIAAERVTQGLWSAEEHAEWLALWRRTADLVLHPRCRLAMASDSDNDFDVE